MTDEMPTPPRQAETDGRSDLRVVLQFFIVPLALVAVLVLIFLGLQFVRNRHPDPRASLRSLESYEGFLAGFFGDLKRWQSGYDLSMLMRAQDEEQMRALLPDLAEAFRASARNDDVRLRRYLALALGHCADPRALEPLREGMRDPDPQTRLFATWGVMRTGDPRGLPDLMVAAHDPDDGIRKMALFALGASGERKVLPVLREALGDAVPDVGWNAALALARFRDPAAVPVLVDLLETADSDPRWDGSATPAGSTAAAGEGRGGAERRELALNAIRGLALLEAPEAAASLRRAARSADPEIRAEARLALSTAGSAREDGPD